MTDKPTRSLLQFEYAGSSYIATAIPGVMRMDLALEKNGARIAGFGFVSCASIDAASGSSVDPVDERMGQIRDAVLVGDLG